MKIRYGKSEIEEATISEGKNGIIYMSVPNTYGPRGIGASSFVVKRMAPRHYDKLNAQKWYTYIDGTKEERELFIKFLKQKREANTKQRIANRERAKVDPCFPKHTGKVTDTTRFSGDTYHTLHCDKCNKTWNIDSGD